MTKQHPEVEVFCYPKTALRRSRRRAWSLWDSVGRLVNKAQATNAAVQGNFGSAFTENSPWLDSGANISSVSRLYYWRIADDTIGKDPLEGFTVEPIYAYRNCRFTPQTDEDPDGDAQFPSLVWVRKKPAMTDRTSGNRWIVVVPDAEPSIQHIKKVGTPAGEDFLATTYTPLEKNQSWQLVVRRFGAPRGNDSPVRLRIRWGGDAWSLLFTDNSDPEFCKNRTDIPSVNPYKQQWKTLRKFAKSGRDSFRSGDDLIIFVYHLAGCIHIALQGSAGTTCVTYTESEKTFTNPPIETPRVVNSPAGKMSISGIGCDVSVGFRKISFCENDDSGGVSGFTGSFDRVFTPLLLDGIDDTRWIHRAIGYVPENTGTTVVVTQVGGVWKYTCTIQSDKHGRQSPFITAVGVTFQHFTQVATMDPIDIAPAVKTIHESIAEPGIMAGGEWNVHVYRKILSDISAQWPNYVGFLNPVKINVGWSYEDGGNVVHGNKTCRVDGFIKTPQLKTPGYGDWQGDLDVVDQIGRLKAPAAIVDQRFMPLAVLHAAIAMQPPQITRSQRTPTASPNAPMFGTQLMGWEGVKYILDTAIGTEHGNLLQVYLPSTHWPIIQWKVFDPGSNSTGIGNDWLYGLPPYGQDAFSWIMKLAEGDFAVFFYIGGVPIYGNYYEIVAASPTHAVYDAEYLGAGDDDVNYILSGMESKHIYEKTFNRFLVSAKLPEGNIPLPFKTNPVLVEERIEDDIKTTFERTLFVESTSIFTTRSAQGIASGLRRQWEGADVRRRPLAIGRGIENLWWGHKIVPHASGILSDPDHDVTGKTLRVVRLDSDIDREKATYKQTAITFPINPATGR